MKCQCYGKVLILATTCLWYELLLGNLRTIHEQLILPYPQANLRKNTLFIDQSEFSNFAFYVITYSNLRQDGSQKAKSSF